MQPEISQLHTLNHKTLTKFAEEYHYLTCDGEACIIYEKKMHNNKYVSVSGGFYYPIPFPKAAEIYVSPEIAPYYGVQFYFQQAELSERLYWGIGLHKSYTDMDIMLKGLRIPFSISYIVDKEGFSPLFEAEINLDDFFTQKYSVGFKSQYDRLMFKAEAGMLMMLFFPLAPTFEVGFCYQLN